MTFLSIWLFFGVCAAIAHVNIVWAIDKNFN